MAKNGVIREMFSENGIMSSKRVVAFMIVSAVLLVLIIDNIKNGLSDNAVTLWASLVGMASILLGITSVTDIWKKPKVNVNVNEEVVDEEKEIE